ncbi:MAG: ATP-binding protein, partial [Desulfonatronovibrio sp.]
MDRFFNNAGPVKPEIHYTIDPLKRVDWEEISGYIDQQRYFVLHAPRQTGKTSTLLSMMKAINEKGQYVCAYANIEGAQAARGDETKGIPSICMSIASAINLYLTEPEVKKWLFEKLQTVPVHTLLSEMLAMWAQTSDKPVVLLLDEVDALVGDTLISLLRQIRSGYAQRPEAFPQSI